ncbi:MAG: twin-arginine translocase subunit TatC [Hyphomicrobiales bacterium]
MTTQDQNLDDSKAPLIEHLTELRSRLLKAVVAIGIAFVVCFIFSNEIFDILTWPYIVARGDDEALFQYTALQELFFTQMKIGFFGAIFIAFHVIASQIYMFMAPGLYRHERSAFYPFLIATPILFIIGASLVYFVVMPLAIAFFLSLEQTGTGTTATITNVPKVSEYLSLIMTLIFAFGTVFQLPVVMTLLARINVVSSEGLSAKRKYAIVLAFGAAAILTPPDPISQISLALPTLVLYEVSIFCVRFVERQRERNVMANLADDDEPGTDLVETQDNQDIDKT